MLALFVVSLRWGAAPEKISSGTLAAMVLIDEVYHLTIPAGHNYYAIDIGHMAQDLLATGSFAYLTLRANRLYPICLLGAQLLVMIAHLDREVFSEIDPTVYSWLIRWPSYIQLGAATAGLVWHIRRQRKHGSYRSWRISSAHS